MSVRIQPDYVSHEITKARNILYKIDFVSSCFRGRSIYIETKCALKALKGRLRGAPNASGITVFFELHLAAQQQTEVARTPLRSVRRPLGPARRRILEVLLATIGRRVEKAVGVRERFSTTRIH